MRLRPVTRTIALAAAFLAVGLVLSIGIAWLCVLTASAKRPARDAAIGTATHAATTTTTDLGDGLVRVRQASEGFSISIDGQGFGYRQLQMVYVRSTYTISGPGFGPDDLPPHMRGDASWEHPRVNRPPRAGLNKYNGHPTPRTEPQFPQWILDARPRTPRSLTMAATAGWPMPCLWSSASPPMPPIAPPVRIAGIDIGRADGRPLPVGPRWLGLAVDTSFYGAIAASLFALTITLRRTRRIHRGRCPRCAYDLGGRLDAGCPECGWNRRP